MSALNEGDLKESTEPYGHEEEETLHVSTARAQSKRNVTESLFRMNSKERLQSLFRRNPNTYARLALACVTDAKVGFCRVVFGHKLNILLSFVPLAIVGHFYSWNSGIIAVLSLLSLCPLAERLGYVTEQLALRTNDTLGALLNVTFGNATELILSIVALQQSEIRLIQLSLIGSVLSNELLVLGSAMVVGGLKYPMQKFSRQPAIIHLVLLVGSSVSLLLPMIVSMTNGSGVGEKNTVNFAVILTSRIISALLVIVYGLFLYFQLHTHKFMFGDEEEDLLPTKVRTIGHSHNQGHNKYTSVMNPAGSDVEMMNLTKSVHKNNEEDFEEDDTSLLDVQDIANSISPIAEEEECEISTCSAVFWLGIIAILISWLSDILVEEIQNGAASQLHIPPAFLYTILVPIVGNAAEHTSALVFCYKNKTDIAFGIAIGSSVQIAILVLPLCVLIAWPMHQNLGLNFNPFETIVYTAAVILTFTIVHDGRSNWLKGTILIAGYLMISIAFWFVRS